MGIKRCEKGFAGILFWSKTNKKNKNHSKNFFARMIPISMINIVFLSYTQIILKQVDKVT